MASFCEDILKYGICVLALTCCFENCFMFNGVEPQCRWQHEKNTKSSQVKSKDLFIKNIELTTRKEEQLQEWHFTECIELIKI
jgi:hypothetical protein